MNKRIRLLLSALIAFFGLFLVGIAKHFNGYLIDSIWWQIPNSWLIGVLGIVIMVLAFKFALVREGVV